MEGSNFVVVANRLPVDKSVDEAGRVTWQASPGGLVTALSPVMKQHGGAWIGWTGAPDEGEQSFEFDGYQVVPVPLSERDIHQYYDGMSNSSIWPLYHDRVARPEFQRDWWQRYVEINMRFAAEVCATAAPGATVWVQDYQLQLVPDYIRDERPDLKIGFFLHIPFPPTELFMQLPARREVIDGLLGADVIGFQAPGAASNFLRLVRRLTGMRTERDRVHLPDGRVALVRAYPISIDANEILALSRTPQVRAEAAELRAALGNPELLLLGVDRLDYTKGLPSRVQAFGELFSDGLLNPEKTVFLQVGSPTRGRVAQYAQLSREIDEMVGRINSSVGRIGSQPVVYEHKNFPRHTMAAMYRAADICVVTPLRDGMNLVCKEYIAAHDSDDGALVLSEFAGAALELRQAYQVNPYDLNGMKEQILRARDDSVVNRRRRMRSMRHQVFTYTITRWADTFLSDLDALGQAEQERRAG